MIRRRPKTLLYLPGSLRNRGPRGLKTARLEWVYGDGLNRSQIGMQCDIEEQGVLTWIR